MKNQDDSKRVDNGEAIQRPVIANAMLLDMQTKNLITEIPISKRHYLIGTLLPLTMLILLIAAYFYASDHKVGDQVFFGGFASFLCFFAGLHISCLLWPQHYVLRVGSTGISERNALSSVEIGWDEIESIGLQSIDGSKRYVVYRLHKKTIMRWFSFGRFDRHHLNQYAMAECELFEIISSAFEKYRVESSCPSDDN